MMPSLPLTLPIRYLKKSTSFWDREPASITSPAMTKKGTHSMGKESQEVNRDWMASVMGTLEKNIR